MQRETFLENLAVSARRLAERARRDPGGAMKGAHEIGEIAKSNVEGDIGDGAAIIGQQAGGVAKPRAHQILVRRHAEHTGKQPQKMKRAQPGFARGTLQINRLMRMGVDPQRRFNRTTAVAGGGTTVSKGGGLVQPLGLALAPNGDILVTNAGNGNMVEVTPAGKQVLVKPADPKAAPAR